MAETVSIDLSPIIDSVRVVNDNLIAVGNKVDAVAAEQAATQDRLEQLYAEFTAFAAADIKHKERQFAQTKLLEVMETIQKRFGHYDEVRRTTTGILQATDVVLVRDETLRTRAEELMLSTPGYWLAPALVALTAWFGDRRDLAERALAEGVKRDDSKISLFFALVCRRARRHTASARWLRRYFQIQNPFDMDREVVLMLDALANGVFGGAALAECSRVIEEWLGELEQQAGFLDGQRRRWGEKLDVMAPRIGSDEYPTLQANSPTWPRLESSLSAVRRNRVVRGFFEDLFTGEIVVPQRLEAGVDALLDSLVTNYDEEELPLRREGRLLQLIVEEGGDRDAARKRMNAEREALVEKTSFAALLTSSAMTPEQFGATRATQRYAVSRSRQWIVAAHQDLVARDRQAVPAEIEISAGSLKCKTADGSDERRLADELSGHYEGRIRDETAAVKIRPLAWIILIAGGVLGLSLLASGSWIAGLVFILAAGAYFYFVEYNGLEKRREQIRRNLETEREQATRILKAGLAEVVDLRRELATEDEEAQKVLDFLESLSSTQFVLKRPEDARATL
jgi:hypothetical protein